MLTHGYRLVYNAKTAPTDYIPSLIAIDEHQLGPNAKDLYFESVELPKHTITSISYSRWVSYDSTPSLTRDPIVGIKAGALSYYVPYSELVALLDDADCDPVTAAVIRALGSNA